MTTMDQDLDTRVPAPVTVCHLSKYQRWRCPTSTPVQRLTCPMCQSFHPRTTCPAWVATPTRASPPSTYLSLTTSSPEWETMERFLQRQFKLFCFHEQLLYQSALFGNIIFHKYQICEKETETAIKVIYRVILLLAVTNWNLKSQKFIQQKSHSSCSLKSDYYEQN